jgi:hypothetical protein
MIPQPRDAYMVFFFGDLSPSSDIKERNRSIAEESRDGITLFWMNIHIFE